jgi:6-phosphogluconolactonase
MFSIHMILLRRSLPLKLGFCGIALFLAPGPGGAVAGPVRVYFGTYTGGKSRGIYVSEFDAADGKLSPPELAAETKDPSFLALHPGRPVLYAVSETVDTNGQRTGAVAAFAIDRPTGKLTFLNRQACGGAGAPCHLAVDRAGQCVLSANYNSGCIAALPLLPDGRLGGPGALIQHHGASLNPQRQAGPHAHFILPDPANRFVLTCDLGLDKVIVYRLGAGSLLEPPTFAGVKPGSGPRHLAFDPTGQFVYVINELSSTLDVFAYAAGQGSLAPVQTVSTLPEGFQGANSAAEVQVHPSGKFVYGSNRGHDSIVIFAADSASGKLTLVGHEPSQGKTPRHFTFDPSGHWLLAENQDSGNVVVFRVDARTGRLTPTGQVVPVGSPVCALFVQ